MTECPDKIVPVFLYQLLYIVQTKYKRVTQKFSVANVNPFFRNIKMYVILWNTLFYFFMFLLKVHYNILCTVVNAFFMFSFTKPSFDLNLHLKTSSVCLTQHNGHSECLQRMFHKRQFHHIQDGLESMRLSRSFYTRRLICEMLDWYLSHCQNKILFMKK